MLRFPCSRQEDELFCSWHSGFFYEEYSFFFFVARFFSSIFKIVRYGQMVVRSSPDSTRECVIKLFTSGHEFSSQDASVLRVLNEKVQNSRVDDNYLPDLRIKR